MVYLLKNTEFNGIQNIQSRKELQNKQNQPEIETTTKPQKACPWRKKNSLYVYIMLLGLIIRPQKYKKDSFGEGEEKIKKL